MGKIAENILRDASGAADKFCETIQGLKEEYANMRSETTNLVVLRTFRALDNLGTYLFRVTLTIINVVLLASKGDIALINLETAKDAALGPTGRCLPGTRSGILKRITSWIEHEDSQIAVLLGAAGLGKSAIAREVACRYSDTDRLISSFAFSRAEASRGPGLFFPTIARDFAAIDRNYNESLGSITRNKPSLLTTSDLQEQFDKLIVEPLKSFISPLSTGPLVIVIDALDECPSDRTKVKDLISFLLNFTNPDGTKQLPRNIRILITSRPEHDIVESIWKGTAPGVDEAVRGVLHFDITQSKSISPRDTEDDIFSYISINLNKSPVQLFPDVLFMRANAAHNLAVKSAPSFQFSSLACKMILSDDLGTEAENRYAQIMALGGSRTIGLLDDLYRQALSSVLNTDNEAVKAKFRFLMSIMLDLNEPLPMSAYEDIVKEHNLLWPGDDRAPKHTDVPRFLGRLGSVLEGVKGASLGQPIRPSHTSFRDFLTNPDRSGNLVYPSEDGDHSKDRKVNFCINPSEHGPDLSCVLLAIMNSKLAFNMCNFPSSHMLNEEWKELSTKRDEHISASLSYASRYWGQHLPAGGLDGIPSDKIAGTRAGLLADFFESKLLVWFEVLSVLGAISTHCASNLRRLVDLTAVRASTSVCCVMFSCITHHREALRIWRSIYMHLR